VGRALFYKLLPGDVSVVAPIAQLGLSIVAWIVLAFAFARCFERTLVRWIASVSILAFSSCALVAQWDDVILSESLSLSLYALVLAAALEVARAPRRGGSRHSSSSGSSGRRHAIRTRTPSCPSPSRCYSPSGAGGGSPSGWLAAAP